MISDKIKIETLGNTPLFENWTEEDLKLIIKNSSVRSYKKNEAVFTQDQTGDRFYVILDGDVIIRSSEDNTSIAEFVTGEMFGEMSIITNENQNAVAFANQDSKILEFPKEGENLSEILSGHLSTYAMLLKSFLVMVSKRMRKANTLIKENSTMMHELETQVYGDKLTGLLNKAYLEENITNFMDEGFSLIMMKPDNFKVINDTYGHEKGDASIIFMGNYLSSFLDSQSILVRYQGNAFAVLTPKQNKEQAKALAVKIKTELESITVLSVPSPDFKFSMSLGVLLYPETKLQAKEFITLCAGMPLIGRERGGSQILFVEDIESERGESNE